MRFKPYPFILFLVLLLFAKPSFAQTGWHELGTPILNSYSNKPVYAMTKNQSGDIIYATIGNNVYKWQGNGWLALGTGSNALNADSYIFSITTDPSGNVYAAGWFSNAFGKPYVAKWNGTSWNELGTGVNALNASGPIYSIIADAAGNIYAAGTIRSATGYIYVAKWNGTSWTELGTGVNALNADGKINAITTDASGNIYAAVSNSNTNSYVAKWNGVTWSVLGSATAGLYRDILTMIVDATGNVLVAGRLQNAAGKFYVAKWNGSGWQELGTGANGINANLDILNLTKDNTGNIYAAGMFYNNTAFKCYVSKWNGTNWTEMGVGSNSLNANTQIYSLVTDASGKVYAGGDFSNSLGYKYVSNWDQSSASWVETGLGGIGTLNSSGEPIVATKNADTVFATFNPYINSSGGNTFQVMMWNGNIWKNFGNINANLGISTMARDGLGNLYAAGSFSLVSHPGVAVSNGGSWQDVGNGANILGASEIDRIVVDSAGNIYATGYFRNSAGKFYVAKWNGTNWLELGTGASSLNSEEVISSMAVDKSGNVYACAYKYFEYGIYKWNGSTWGLVASSPFDTPLDAIQSIAVDDNGVVYSTMTDWPGNYVRKWNGSSWIKVGGFGSGAVKIVPGYKNNIFIVCYDDNKVKRFNGSGWSVVGAATSGELVPGQSLYSDALGNLYCRAKHTGTTNYYVAKFDAALLDAPVIVNVSDKCSDIPSTKGKLWNPPASGAISITQDGLPLAYNAADSSFQYFTNGVTSSGNHTVIVKYTIGTNVLTDSVSYKVSTVIVPVVSITTPDTVVCANTFFTLTCNVNIRGAGYQWYLDGWPCIYNCNDSAMTLTLTSGTPSLNIYCKVTLPGSGCFSSYSVNSNSIVVKQGIVNPSVTITGNDPDNIICDNQLVTFTATPAKAGNTPSYSWRVNGITSGTNSNTYSSSSLKNGDQVKVIITSSVSCAGQPTATSNVIPIAVWPTNFQKPDSMKSICAGFNLSIPIGITTLTGYTYYWTSQPAGFVSSLANPVVKPVVSTKYTLLQTHTLSGCTNSSFVNVQLDTGCAARGIVVAPNPANDHLFIQLNVNNTEPKYFDLINSSGVLVLEKPLSFTTSIDTRNIPNGIYFYRITVGFGTLMKSGKLIIQH